MRYYERYIAIAKAAGLGFLESPTWRASADWGGKLGYSRDAIATNRDAIALMCKLSAIHATSTTPIIISGCVGPRGDGYDPVTSCRPRRRRPTTLTRSAPLSRPAPT